MKILSTIAASLIAAAGLASAASVSYTFAMDKAAGFGMDPNSHKSVGYLLALKGFSTTAPIEFQSDLKVNLPLVAQMNVNGLTVSKAGANALGTASVVGVLERFSWNGGVDSALSIDAWVSQQ